MAHNRAPVEMSAVNTALALVVVTCFALVSVPKASFAQDANDPNMAGQFMGRGGGHQRHGRAQQGPRRVAPVLAPLPQVRDPWPRLDAGALLCRTEAELQQHQAATAVRLAGGTAAEPSGCQFVQAMTPVTVAERDGLSRTEVRLQGASGPQLAWTDEVIPEERPSAQ
jgi:hypothetical protein